MLDNEQLQKIGFRYVTDSVELMTPYGEELKRRARFYGKGEEKELEREQENIGKLVRLIGEKPEKVKLSKEEKKALKAQKKQEQIEAAAREKEEKKRIKEERKAERKRYKYMTPEPKHLFNGFKTISLFL